jgi:3-oxoacyl-[acyl-carrier-protein] synthase-3
VEAVANSLHIPIEKFFVNIQEYGNTGSASIPIALSEAFNAGRIREGDIVLTSAFGAGFHWAAAILQF